MPLNDDKTIPTVDRMLGGVGPFDFSGVTDNTQVALSIKQDDGTVSSIVVDISTAADQTAVTVAEVVSALQTGCTPALTTIDITASSGTGKNGSTRPQLATSLTTSKPSYIQVYGEFAEIAKFGQGFGLKFVKADTLTSMSKSPNMKEDEEFTITDAEGDDTEIITDGYLKGITGNIVDTAKDPELAVLVMGGSYNSTTGVYEAPTSESVRYYWFAEVYSAYYSQGTNKEADLVGYVQRLIRSAKGTVGDATKERDWSFGNYSYNATTYDDENGNKLGAYKDTYLTASQYSALTLSDV
jgi:hypothetical protein